MKKINLAIIGCSKIAEKIIPHILESKKFNIVAVASTNLRRAKNFAKRNRIKNYYGSYEECSKNKNVDCVYISNFNTQHFLTSKLFLENRKHVLCEKPITQNKFKLAQLKKIAKKNDLTLLEGMILPFQDQIKKIIELSSIKNIGTPTSIDIEFCFNLYDTSKKNRALRSLKKNGGGAWNDLGCYATSFLELYLKSINYDFNNIKVVKSKSRRDSEIDLETWKTIKIAPGLFANIHVAVDQQSSNLWKISGTKKTIAALRTEPQEIKKSEIFIIDSDSTTKKISVPYNNFFKEELIHFYNQIFS
jgi:predicted dehydrogenase